jgi:hypothetical protein
VFAFLSLIAPRIATSKIGIMNNFPMKPSHMEHEKQLASVNQLLQLFKEKIATIQKIVLYSGFFRNMQFLRDVDNKMERMVCSAVNELDIPILTEFLASPRADGQQRVMKLEFDRYTSPGVVQKLLDAIKKVYENPYDHMCFSFF